MTIPMYIAEASPAKTRGRLVSTNIAMVACGQFIANVVDGIFSGNVKDGWRYAYRRSLNKITCHGT